MSKNHVVSEVRSLTRDSLYVFCRDVSKEIAGAAATRLGIFKQQAEQTDVPSFEKACKECLSSHKSDADASVIKVRISESRQLYGAIRFCGLDVSEKGFWSAITESRKLLKAKGIRYDGSQVIKLTPEAKQVKAQIQRKAKAVKELTPHFDFNQVDAQSKYDDALTDKIAELEQSELEDSKAKAMDRLAKHGSQIIADYGMDYAFALSVWLSDKVAEASGSQLVAVAA